MEEVIVELTGDPEEDKKRLGPDWGRPGREEKNPFEDNQVHVNNAGTLPSGTIPRGPMTGGGLVLLPEDPRAHEIIDPLSKSKSELAAAKVRSVRNRSSLDEA